MGGGTDVVAQVWWHMHGGWHRHSGTEVAWWHMGGGTYKVAHA